MSRVNEALKRVSQQDRVEQKNLTAPARAVSPAPPRQNRFPIAAAAATLVLAATAIWIFSRAHAANPMTAPQAQSVALAQSVPSPILRASSPSPQSAPKPVTIATVAAASNAPSQPQFPRIKLQAIFFAQNSARALLNGDTIAEGDLAAGARVKRIEPDQVILE